MSLLRTHLFLVSLIALVIAGALLVIPYGVQAAVSPVSPVAPAAAEVSVSYGDIMKQGIIFAGICGVGASPAVCPCRDDGACTLDDMLQVAVNISVFILGISGSIILLVFVYCGFMWITARGKTEFIEKGRKTFVGASVGLVIIFTAYAVIVLLISVLKTGELPDSGATIESVIEADPIEGSVR